MRLQSAARYFDKVACADAYTPAVTFKGQLDVFDDSKRDGATVLRRILSVAPDVTLPARRTITAEGDTWLIGAGHKDSFNGEAIRTKHIIHRADGAATIKTAAQALATGGTASYASRLWIKDLKEVEVSSSLFSMLNVYLAPGETVAIGNLILLSGRLHLVRNVYTGAAGLLIAESDELAANAVASVTYTPRGGAYVPASDTVVPGSPVVLNLLRTRFQDDYVYQNEAAPRYVEGDIRGSILKSALAVPKVDDYVTLADGDWRVLSIDDDGLTWGLHLRHV